VIIHKFLVVHHRLDLASGTDSNSDRLCRDPRVTISALPDDVLLEIFVYVVCQTRTWSLPEGPKHFEDGWRMLVHVCKRWRSVVFSSPRRLNLRLLCTNRRPVTKLLNIWPPLPIYIFACNDAAPMLPLTGVTNIVAALKQHDRVCEISIYSVPSSVLGSSVTKEPFPVLKKLSLSSLSNDERSPALPDSFLGGSAPRLQTLYLAGIPFPGLGKLLLSTTDLVSLSLHDIPHSGYISPEAMVASLSTLAKLEALELFLFPRSRADREN
jgi:hypothetical protein